MKCVLSGGYGWSCKQKPAKASIPPIYLCIKYRAVKSSAGVPPGFAVRHRLGVAQAGDGDRSSQHGGVSVCWPTWPSWPSSSRRTRGTRLSTLDSRGTPCCTLCLVSASWKSVGWRDPTARLGGRNPHGSRPPACLPDAPNVNGKCKCTTACDSARACPALPDFFLCPPSPRVRQLTAWL